MLQRIKEFADKHKMIEKEDIVLLGVSGGADSVSLLLILDQLREQLHFGLEAIHVEHGIRGADSLSDTEFTRDLCKKLQVPCHVEHVKVLEYSKKHGLGHEEAARILRYEVFVAYAEKRAKASGRKVKIALAHHMEDNSETILFQMIRGSGIKGLCGISPVREDEGGNMYIRPLLCVGRREIENFLEAREQPYCIDKTNKELVYTRNRLRNIVLPELDKINEHSVEHINKSALQLREIWEYMQLQCERELENIVKKELPLTVDSEELCMQPSALRSMLGYELIALATGKKKDITSRHVELLLGFAKAESGRKLNLPYGVQVKKEYNYLIFEKNLRSEIMDEELVLEVAYQDMKKLEVDKGIRIRLGDEGEELVLTKRCFDGKMEKIPKKKCTKWIDYDKIGDSFQVRRRKSGDYFINDQQGHHKKLKQYFIDRKIPQSQRNQMWLMAIGAEVVWILGDRMGETYKVSQETELVLELEYLEGR